MSYFIFQYFSNEDGATAIEYGLIGAGISIAIAAVVFTMGDQLLPIYNSVVAILTDAAGRT